MVWEGDEHSHYAHEKHLHFTFTLPQEHSQLPVIKLQSHKQNTQFSLVPALDNHIMWRVLTVLTYAPETGSSNRCHRPQFDARLRHPKAVNDVRSCASAWKTGTGIWRRIYGTDFWSQFLECVSGLKINNPVLLYVGLLSRKYAGTYVCDSITYHTVRHVPKQTGSTTASIGAHIIRTPKKTR